MVTDVRTSRDSQHATCEHSRACGVSTLPRTYITHTLDTHGGGCACCASGRVSQDRWQRDENILPMILMTDVTYQVCPALGSLSGGGCGPPLQVGPLAPWMRAITNINACNLVAHVNAYRSPGPLRPCAYRVCAERTTVGHAAGRECRQPCLSQPHRFPTGMRRQNRACLFCTYVYVDLKNKKKEENRKISQTV